MKISRNSFIWLAIAVALFLFLRKPVEGFQATGKPNSPGCPCNVADDCYTLNCKEGKCGDFLGRVPETPPGPCIRNIDTRKQKKDKLNVAGCPCNESAQCTERLCRDGRCTTSIGIIPTITASPEICPIKVEGV